MALMIKQIIGRNLLDGAELVAGLKGKDNEVLWVNVMEILDAPDSVQRGELLITTGYQLNDETRHRNLIKILKNRGVSGMAVQLGYYIDAIPAYILNMANELDFPILTIPSRLTFSFIMHTLMEEITSAGSGKTVKTDDTLYKKIREKIEKEKFVLEESTQNFLFVIKENENDISRNTKETVAAAINSIRSFLETQPGCKSICVQEEKSAVVVLELPRKKAQQNIVFELTILLTFTSEQQHINFFVGVDEVKQTESIGTGYEHAMECIRVLKSIGAKRGVGPFNNLTFFELFGTLLRNNSSILLGNDSLQKLLLYDRGHETAYVHTLRV